MTAGLVELTYRLRTAITASTAERAFRLSMQGERNSSHYRMNDESPWVRLTLEWGGRAGGNIVIAASQRRPGMNR